MLNVGDKIIRKNLDGIENELTVIMTQDQRVTLSDQTVISRNKIHGSYQKIPRSPNPQHLYLDVRVPVEEKTFWEKVGSFNAQTFFSAPSTALTFAAVLLLGQSWHTGHCLLDLSPLPTIPNYIFAVLTAVFVDGLILFFLSRGNAWYSFAALVACFVFNLYSYHIGIEWGTYKSWFAFIPSLAIPYFLHGVAKEMNKS